MISSAGRYLIATYGAAFICLGSVNNVQGATLDLGKSLNAGTNTHVSQDSELDDLAQHSTDQNQNLAFSPCASFSDHQALNNSHYISSSIHTQRTQLIAQAASPDTGSFLDSSVEFTASDICDLQAAGIGGGSTAAALNPILFSPLGALGLLLDGSDDASETSEANSSAFATSLDDTQIQIIPEPMTVLGTGVALGLGVLFERKRKRNSKG